MSNFIDYYKLLGIAPNAKAAEIDSAYHEAVKREHPDVSKHPNADERTRVLNEAHSVLRNPVKREVYDRKYDQQRVGGAARPRRGREGTERRSRRAEREWPDREEASSGSTGRRIVFTILALSIMLAAALAVVLPEESQDGVVPEPLEVATPPAAPPPSGYAYCGSDAIRVYWFDSSNSRKRHIDITGEEATRIFGENWWSTIGYMSQSECDSWPTGNPLHGRP